MNQDIPVSNDIPTPPPQLPPYEEPGDPASSRSDTIESVTETATDQLRHAAVEVKERGGEALEDAKQAGNHMVDEQVEKFASRIDQYTEAVRAACETLEATEGNPLVGPAHKATRQLERAANYLRSHHAMDFLDDLGALARRKPEIVFGSLFVVGLASVRFLKASSRDRRGSPKVGYQDSYHRSPNPYQPLSGAPYAPNFSAPHLIS